MLRIQQRVKFNGDLTLMELTVQWKKQIINHTSKWQITIVINATKGSQRVLKGSHRGFPEERHLKERSERAKTVMEVERIIWAHAF